MFETVFKALGEPTRLKIVKLLAVRDLCVCDLEEVMQISQPRISQHLKVLKYAGLVNERKEGQRSICSLNKEFLFKVWGDFQMYIDQPLENMTELSAEFARMPDIAGEYCVKGNCNK
jgi:ArsR family transcriptional regulator